VLHTVFKEDEMGVVCSTTEAEKKFVHLSWRSKGNEPYSLEYLGVYGRIILKWILKE
jgi:hypothetical protein